MLIDLSVVVVDVEDEALFLYPEPHRLSEVVARDERVSRVEAEAYIVAPYIVNETQSVPDARL